MHFGFFFWKGKDMDNLCETIIIYQFQSGDIINILQSDSKKDLKMGPLTNKPQIY